MYLSAITIVELRYGIARLRSGESARTLEKWLVTDVQLEFDGRVLALDADATDRWGQLQARAAAAGRPIPVIDGLIAATALQHNLAVVTRNVADFERVGANVLNPWTDGTTRRS